MTGRISFEGDSDPELYSSVNVSAVPVDFDRTPQNLGFPASAEIQADLTLKLAGLTGARVLRLLDPPPGWMLKAVLLNGRDITDTPVVFSGPNQSVEGIEVVLTNRASEIAGQALDARARGLAGVRVVVFSTDRQEWIRDVALSRRQRSDQAGRRLQRRTTPARRLLRGGGHLAQPGRMARPGPARCTDPSRHPRDPVRK